MDEFNARGVLKTPHGDFTIYRLYKLEEAGLTNLARLPYAVRVLLESVLRQQGVPGFQPGDVRNLAGWKPQAERQSMPFIPGRVVMQDFTGVPAVVDLAAMRSAMARAGGDPTRINPLIPVDLVIDHSVQVDFFGTPDALQRNAEMEFQRNRERYEFLRWGQKSFANFRVVPPATGIIHQVNLEYLAEVVLRRKSGVQTLAFPDTVVGTDSHTTMINALGVVGWGVGGIEAEAAMLGQPMDMLIPDVVGFRVRGALREGVTATDLVLTVTQMLRKHGVVGKFVEFFGPGLTGMSLPDRATISNMAPEYGATIGFFPVDDETLRYLRLSGRPEELVDLVERYSKEQGLFRTPDAPDPQYSALLDLDLNAVEPSLAGPKRPQDRVPLSEVKTSFLAGLRAPQQERGYGLSAEDAARKTTYGTNGGSLELAHGAVVLAAITSCTNTSNPSVMIQAGLLAKNAVARGLKVKPYVKTSLAPGSRVVSEYLHRAGLLEPLAALGFDVVGYGCTTCIGNSGPLPVEVVRAVTDADLVAAAVLSGNRNFEGRVHPYVRANYLASPPLVVAYAIAGRIDLDLTREPLGTDGAGNPVYFKDIFPSAREVQDTAAACLNRTLFEEQYEDVFQGSEIWNKIRSRDGDVYAWDEDSTYIQEPPFFKDFSLQTAPLSDIHAARVLAFLGDSITTDHISPAGTIPMESPAGRYLRAGGVDVRDFNSFGARRGNDRVMVRGTFGNIRLKNRLVPGVEGGVTVHLPDGTQMPIYDAAEKYRTEDVPLIILAGKEYGSGSSRDWAAKGTFMLGVRAVLAESYERIHRSNLVGMGVLPLQFRSGENADSLGLSGQEIFDIEGIHDGMAPRSLLKVSARRADGSAVSFEALCRLDTPQEVQTLRHGGILQMVLRSLMEGKRGV